MTDNPAPSPAPALTKRGTHRQRRPRARRAIVPTPEMLADAPEFAPVSSATNRHDGWTYERQRAFIAGLAETGCVDRAAQRIGMTSVGAYRLRKLPGADAFAAAWADAQALGVQKLSDIAFDRAINGIPVPIFYKGEQVGERRWYNDRLLMFTLRHQAPDTYGIYATAASVPPHIRRALREEWEAERKGKDESRDAPAIRARIAAKIEAALRMRFVEDEERVPEERRLAGPAEGGS